MLEEYALQDYSVLIILIFGGLAHQQFEEP